MATNISKRFKGKVRDAYLELINKFPLTSIRSADELDAAQTVMDELLAKGKLSRGEGLYLDALSDLVAAYEDERHDIAPASDADMLRHFMEAHGITQATLHRNTGIAKSTISEILADKRPFSRQIIGKLAAYFEIDKSILSHNL